MLDATDSIAADGLVMAGYNILMIEECDALMDPSHRPTLASYVSSRGLSLVFAQLAAQKVRTQKLRASIFPDSGDEMACLSRALAGSSGEGGWNDVQMQLTVEATAADRAIAAATVVAAAEAAGKIPSIDDVTAASTSIPPFAQRVRGLRVKLSQLCMHRQPIVLAPSLRTSLAPPGLAGGRRRGGDPAMRAGERTRVLATLANRAALYLHETPFNASGALEAQRHPMQLDISAENVKVWVRHFAEKLPSSGAPSITPAGTSTSLFDRFRWAPTDASGGGGGAPPAVSDAAPVSSLLLVNSGRTPANLRLPHELTHPFSPRRLYVVSAWANASKPSDPKPGAQLSSLMRPMEVPAFDAVLLLLFASAEGARRFEEAAARPRGAR